MEDIILKTFDLDLSKDLITVYDNRKLFDILSINLNKEDTQIEQVLCVKFRKLLHGEVDDLENVEGYQQLVDIFETGGL